MTRPAMQELSGHARQRAIERGVPEYVMELFQKNEAFIAQGSRGDKNTHYHIIRVSNLHYYVGVERENVAVTFILVDKPYNWFRRRLLNFDHMYQQICNLPVHRNPSSLQAKKRRDAKRKSRRTSKRVEVTRELAELFGVEF